MIIITKSAQSRINNVAAAIKTKQVLRITVESGGCSGYQYIMEMTSSFNDEDDVLVTVDGLTLVAIDKFSSTFLQECELDFVENLSGGSFRIHNPKAKSSCGCGNSFELSNNISPSA